MPAGATRLVFVTTLVCIAYGTAQADDFDCASQHMRDEYESIKRLAGRMSSPYEEWCLAEAPSMRRQAEMLRRTKAAGSVAAAELCSWRDPFYLGVRWERRAPRDRARALPEPLRSFLEAEQFLREVNAESLSWVIKQWNAKRTVIKSLERVGEPTLSRIASQGFSARTKQERAVADQAFESAARQQLFLKYFEKECLALVAAVDQRGR